MYKFIPMDNKDDKNDFYCPTNVKSISNPNKIKKVLVGIDLTEGDANGRLLVFLLKKS